MIFAVKKHLTDVWCIVRADDEILQGRSDLEAFKKSVRPVGLRGENFRRLQRGKIELVPEHVEISSV